MSDKLKDNMSIPKLNDGQVVNLTEAAEMLGITRQYSWRKAHLYGQPNGWKTLKRVGTKPSYTVEVAEIEELLRAKQEDSAEESAS